MNASSHQIALVTIALQLPHFYSVWSESHTHSRPRLPASKMTHKKCDWAAALLTTTTRWTHSYVHPSALFSNWSWNNGSPFISLAHFVSAMWVHVICLNNAHSRRCNIYWNRHTHSLTKHNVIFNFLKWVITGSWLRFQIATTWALWEIIIAHMSFSNGFLLAISHHSILKCVAHKT